MKQPLLVNTFNFECCVLESEIPVLLVFGACWDPLSIRLYSQLERCVEKCEGEFLLGKVEYDYNQIIYHKYQIPDIPSMAFFENGKIIKIVSKEDFLTIKSVGAFIDWYYGIYPYY